LLLLASDFSFEAAKGWLAAHWAASPRSEDWFRAASLEPGNAEYCLPGHNPFPKLPVALTKYCSK
jgi:hypothetical protein